MALKRKPDLILPMDGDEMMMPFSKEILFEEIVGSKLEISKESTILETSVVIVAFVIEVLEEIFPKSNP